MEVVTLSATYIIRQGGLESNGKRTPATDSQFSAEDKIVLCLNTKFKGKYHGPQWGKFNDGFEPVEVDAYEHAQTIHQGRATCPVVHGRRKKANFVSAQHIGLDFDTEDDHARLDRLEDDPFIAQYGVIIHTTASHTEEKPRARVFFYLDQPVIDPDQYRRCVMALLKLFALADQKAKDPARMFFGAENCEVRILNDGHNRLPLAVLESLATELLPLAVCRRAKLDWAERNFGHPFHRLIDLHAGTKPPISGPQPPIFRAIGALK
jgi:extradiol dioxygenase family protein